MAEAAEIRVLVVEDNESDAELIRESLSGIDDPRYEIEQVAALSAGLELLARREFDVILLDLDLLDSRGQATFLKMHSEVPHIPIVVLTGHQDEARAVEAVQEGAQDYLVKGRTGGELLVRAIRYAISRHQVMEELRQHALELQASEARFRQLVNRNADGVVVLSDQGRVRFLNPAAKALFGDRARNLPGGELGIPVTGGDLTEVEIRDRRGELRIAQMRAVETEWEGEKAFLVSLRDVTERKRAEKEILEISEREQRRIGQELHDSLGQQLTGASLFCKALERKLAAKALPEASDATRLAGLLKQALDQTQGLAHSLHPVHLDPGDFATSLRELASTAEEILPISCQVEAQSPVRLADQGHAVHLYRIAQEAVTNAVKHGKARNVWIRLGTRDGRVELDVEDDGIGLPAESERTKGLGVSIMKYRADMIGATLDMQRTSGPGTLVRVSCAGPT